MNYPKALQSGRWIPFRDGKEPVSGSADLGPADSLTEVELCAIGWAAGGENTGLENSAL